MCGITSGNELRCWGRGWEGQLGNGDYSSRSIPTLVSGGSTFTDLAGGSQYTCAVATGGSLYCWGQNQQGELGLGWVDLINTPTAVVGGMTFVTPPPRR
jgi:alpha-tubulin suppressor-like RCC1 family protein